MVLRLVRLLASHAGDSVESLPRERAQGVEVPLPIRPVARPR